MRNRVRPPKLQTTVPEYETNIQSSTPEKIVVVPTPTLPSLKFLTDNMQNLQESSNSKSAMRS